MTATIQPLTASLEDYLETILLLTREHAVARSRDISARLKVTQASVTGALQSLSERGLINYEPYGFVTLTRPGKDEAGKVMHRHEVLRDFFVNILAIDKAEAEQAACRMEHGISKQVVDRLVEFARFIEECPRAGEKWVQGFAYFCKTPKHKPSDCAKCVLLCLDNVEQKGNTLKIENKEKHHMTLSKLKPGQKGSIEKINGSSAIKRRIADMGVTKNSMVEVVRVAPMGDPIDVKIKGYHLSLRKDEAADIVIKKME